MENGDCFDIVEILSTAKRDFLVRNNNDQVKIESLRKKTICIYFAFLLKECAFAKRSMILAEVYNELQPEGEFEVVFVAVFEDGCGSPEMKKQKIEGKEIEGKKLFDNIFSNMPWLSIPFHDVDTRNHLCKLFSMPPSEGSGFMIINPNGKILCRSDWCSLRDYGAEAYPFTDERIEDIEESDNAFRENLSLKTLLVSPTRDFVINNKLDEVPISELDGKLVGLFLYGGKRGVIIEKLLEAYDKLKEGNKNFAVVLINLHFLSGYSDEVSFNEKLKEMPWFSLPFMDNRTRKAWRILGYPGAGYTDKGSLAIFGPKGKLLETYSSTILEEYGSDAYPFTQEKAVEIEMKRIEQVTIERLFNEANQDSVITKNGTKIPFSTLKGKSIFLFCPQHDLSEGCEELPKLKEWYVKEQGENEALEVIFVGMDNYGQKSYDDLFSEMPWLAFACDSNVCPVYYELLGGTKLLRNNSYELVAFGPDGHIVTMKALPHLQAHGFDACPFNEDNIAKEIFDDISERFTWYI